MSTNRRAIHAYVSEDAHDKWHDFAAENGVSVSALLEALADTVAEPSSDLPQQTVLENAVTASRRIDAARRRRRKD